MYCMDNCCQRSNNDAEGCQRLSGIRTVNKAQSGGDRNVGTNGNWSQNVPYEKGAGSSQLLRQISCLKVHHESGLEKMTHCMDP